MEKRARLGMAAAKSASSSRIAADFPPSSSVTRASRSEHMAAIFLPAAVDAVKAGDIEKAKALYAPTRQHYERIEPIAELFSDLDGSIDAREDDYEQKAADPKFTGFHRLEKALFGDNSTKGMDKYAGQLNTNVLELQKRIS